MATVVYLPKWWKRKDHRKIKGARGARFASLNFHYVFFFSIIVLVEYIMRSTDSFQGDQHYHIADPPVPAPPPLEKTLGYSLTSEMPYLKSLELERTRPAHIPKKDGINLTNIREGKSDIR